MFTQYGKMWYPLLAEAENVKLPDEEIYFSKAMDAYHIIKKEKKRYIL